MIIVDLCKQCKRNPINVERSKRLCSICLDNHCRRVKEYNKSHTELVSEYKKIYYNKNKERLNVISKEWRQNNSDRYKELWDEYYKTHHEDMLNRTRKYYRDNKERVCLHAKEYRQTHLEYYSEKDRLRDANKTPHRREQVLANNRRRRTRKLGLLDHYTDQEWKDCINYWNNRCVNCGSTSNIEADHITPISRGGTDTIDNIQPLCRHCNASKHTKTIDYRWECT